MQLGPEALKHRMDTPEDFGSVDTPAPSGLAGVAHTS